MLNSEEKEKAETIFKLIDYHVKTCEDLDDAVYEVLYEYRAIFYPVEHDDAGPDNYSHRHRIGDEVDLTNKAGRSYTLKVVGLDIEIGHKVKVFIELETKQGKTYRKLVSTFIEELERSYV